MLYSFNYKYSVFLYFQSTSVLVPAQNKVFFEKFCCKYLSFFKLFITKKCWKWLFWPAFGVCSTQMLVKIYNRHVWPSPNLGKNAKHKKHEKFPWILQIFLISTLAEFWIKHPCVPGLQNPTPTPTGSQTQTRTQAEIKYLKGNFR